MLICLTIGGCDRWSGPPPIEAQPEVAEADLRRFYCDHTEDSRFTDDEVRTRTEGGWTRNLAISYRVNARRDQWCSEG